MSRDDIGGRAAVKLRGKLLEIAVAAAELRLDHDVGMRFHVFFNHLDGRFVARVAAPPHKAKRHLVFRSGGSRRAAEHQRSQQHCKYLLHSNVLLPLSGESLYGYCSGGGARCTGACATKTSPIPPIFRLPGIIFYENFSQTCFSLPEV